MTSLHLWPGLLPLHEARWARASRLEASDGVLRVHRGRRLQTVRVPGGRLHPVQPVRDLRVSCPFALVDADGRVRATIDLAEWVPAGAQPVGRRPGQGMGPPFPDVRDALAKALHARPSSTPWTDEAGATLSPVDVVARRRRQGVLLALAVLALGSMFTGVAWLLTVGGLAAIALVLLGMSPVRRWSPRAARWSMRSRHLGDEVALDATLDVLRVVDTASGRAGCAVVGRDAHQLSAVHAGPDALRLMTSAAGPVVDLNRRTWRAEPWARLREHLEATPGLPIRERNDLAPWRGPPRLVSTAAMPATAGGDLVLALVLGAVAAVAAAVSSVAALLYAGASLTAVVLALELVVTRPRTDTGRSS